MPLATQSLPDDPDALRVFARDLQAELARKDIELAANAAEIHAKTLHIEKLRMQLAVLRRARFGQSSEKIDGRIEQLELLIGELEEEEAATAARREATPPSGSNDLANPAARERRQPVRRPLPPHLPRETVTHEPPQVCPECGGSRFRRIGDDEREVLEYTPASFRVIRHVRPKLSCRGCETIVQRSMPSLPIERGLPGPGLITQVLVAKYCDHLPLHRQSGIYQRAGVELDRATLADWVGRAVFLLAPLAEAIGHHVRAGPVLHADDTTVPVLAPGLGKTRTGRLWVVVRDERGFGSTVPPGAFYLYSPDRKAVHAERLLSACRGWLHADGYNGFRRLYEPRTAGAEPGLIEVACWAHARRKFQEACEHTPSPIAREALERIAALLAVETHVRGDAHDQRAAARAKHSRHRLADLRGFLETSLTRISGKSGLAEAIRYALTRWTALSRYLDDGRLEMTNNAAERGMKAPILGRKNYMFMGSNAGGERAACLYTLIETAKMNQVDPQAWLTDVIGRIADHPISRINEFLPWNWRSRIA
jgi:transposase